MQSVLICALVDLIRSVKAITEDERNVADRVEKGEFDYATGVDLKVQQYIEGALKALYPSYQFMGEEHTREGLDLDRPTWILDPIDGTTNLIHHYPQCAVALGLMVEREITLGVIYNPFLDQMFTAEKGMGAYLNGHPIHASNITSLHESLVSIGTAPYVKQHARHDFEVVSDIFMRCQDIRRVGAAALEMAFVAWGIVECYYERNLMPWDYAAGKILVTEAGGRVTTLTGEPLPIGHPSPCLVTNGHVHEEMLGFTKRFKV